MKHTLLLPALVLFNLSVFAQNVGIGTSNPALAGLVVDKAVGSTYAAFGSNSTGVSIHANWPGVGFNEYYNGGAKFMSAGYAGVLNFSPTDGSFSILSSSAAGTANGTATLNTPFTFYGDGGLGISGPNATYAFRDRSLSNYGGWGWYANNGNASLYRYTSGGELLTISPVGNVGIGTNSPSAKLDVRSNGSGYGVYIGKTGDGAGLGVSSTSSSPSAYLFNNNGPALIADGRVSIGMGSYPTQLLDVGGRMRLRNQDANTTAGIFLDGKATPNIGFIGTFDNAKIGFFGAGVGWGMLFDVNNGRLGVGTGEAAPNSKLQVGGSLSLPIKEIADNNYAATDDDYAIKIYLSQNTNFEKTVTLPAASGRAGRVYIISSQIPSAGPSTFAGISPARVRIKESGTNKDIFQDNGISINNSLHNFISVSTFSFGEYQNYYLRNSCTVQSNGSRWILMQESKSDHVYFIPD